MIVVDTSSLIAYLDGQSGEDVRALEEALLSRQVMMTPVVLTEIFSAPNLPREVRSFLLDIPCVELRDGYWIRSGELRSRLNAKGLKARLADTLIAQSCLDEGIALLTRDKDFRKFAKEADLQLVTERT